MRSIIGGRNVPQPYAVAEQACSTFIGMFGASESNIAHGFPFG
jgi:hypothetical protein